jgi:4-hydroxy-2-oxoheptanedioate aldolase
MDVIELKARLKAAKPVFGTWSHLPYTTVVEIVGAAGLDFIVFDMEHGPHSMADMPALYCAAENRGLVPVTRVPGAGNSNILRVLDSGTRGVMVPHVDSAAFAAECLEAMVYGPSSRNRGIATLTRSSMFNYKDERLHLDGAAAKTLSVLMVEDRQGIDDIDAICDLPGLDVLFLGIYDMSQSLGLKGDLTDPVFQKVFRDTAKRVADKGVAIGCYAHTAEAAEPLIDLGVRFITIGVDGGVLRRGYDAVAAGVARWR